MCEHKSLIGPTLTQVSATLTATDLSVYSQVNDRHSKLVTLYCEYTSTTVVAQSVRLTLVCLARDTA